MDFCYYCGEQIAAERHHKMDKFCSTSCMDNYYLSKCQDGKISFLDIPLETRKRELNIKSYTSHAHVCKVCGTIFYTASYFGESKKTCCSRLCMRVYQKTLQTQRAIYRTGWLSPNWRGGITHDKYCYKFNENLKERVRKFFNNQCFICGKTQKEVGQSLSVHHVNYNKNACCDSSQVMMVPLCLECHGKTNSNRDYWEKHIETILKEKYNYKCYYTKEEYLELKPRKYKRVKTFTIKNYGDQRKTYIEYIKSELTEGTEISEVYTYLNQMCKIDTEVITSWIKKVRREIYVESLNKNN